MDPSKGVPPEELRAEPSGPFSRRVAEFFSGGWFLRATGFVVFLTAVLGALVVPGLRGLARDTVVESTSRIAWTFGYFAAMLLAAGVLLGTYQLSFAGRVRGVGRGIAVFGATAAVALASPAVFRPLPAPVSIGLAVAAALAGLGATFVGLKKRHTRAVAFVVGAFAIAALLRVGAWEVARAAGDAADTSLYRFAQAIATVGLVFEALGQMVAAAWLGTRSRIFGQILSSAAVGVAFILTVEAAHGASVSASAWDAGLHVALASAAGLPQPMGPPSLPTFLLAGSVLLSGVAVVQTRQVVAVTVALALALIGRGALDVPVHALAAAAGALWLAVASGDERAVWASLLEGRAPRRAALPSERTERVDPT